MTLLPGRLSVQERSLLAENATLLGKKLLEYVPGLLYVNVSVHRQDNLTITFQVSSDHCTPEWFHDFTRKVKHYIGGNVIERTVEESIPDLKERK